MTSDLVPAPARRLPPPLSTTSRNRDELPLGPGEDPVRLADRVLAALAEIPPVADDDVPADLLTGWTFTAEWLAEAMPTLDSITPEALRRRLAEQGEPPAAVVDAVGRFWVRWLLEASLWTLLSRVGKADAGQVTDLARRRVPAAGPVVGAELVRTLAEAAGPAAGPLLGEFAADGSLPAAVREQARRELNGL